GADGRVVGRALDAAVPAVVLRGAVAVRLAVGLVVLLVVTDQVPEREAVVAGHEVDRVGRLPARGLVQVGAAADARRQPAGRPRASPPPRSAGRSGSGHAPPGGCS